MRLKDLPEDVRKKALQRQKECQIKAKKEVKEDINEHLLTAFSWRETKEGDDYWVKIYKKYRL